MSKKGGKQEAVVIEAPTEPTINTGKDEFNFPDGSKYIGEWREVDGVKTRDGYGVYSCGPEKYSGLWISDKMHGEGEYVYASGAIYKGQFEDNMMHGEGEYIFPDGAVYSGSWHRNKMHGQGNYIDKEKNEFKGTYVNGMYDSGRSYISVRSS